MNKQQLGSLTRSYDAFDGAVTFHMIPYRTMGFHIALRELASSRGLNLDDLPTMEGDDVLFAIADTLTADITFHMGDDASAELQALRYYWTERNGATIDNMRLFNQWISPTVRDAWFEAYNATRDKAGAPETTPGE